MERYIGAESNEFPYAAVTYIEATFPDGSTIYGSGALVGANDVLTAAHIIYDPQRGGQAIDVTVAPGKDGNRYPFDSFQGVSLDYYKLALDEPNSIRQSESQKDLAIIGLEHAVGDELGWFELAPFSQEGNYKVTGYPGKHFDAQGARMVESGGTVTQHQHYDLIGLEGFATSPGNSGSPVWLQNGSTIELAGVVSTLSWAALVEASYGQLQSWISGNDSLIKPMPEADQDSAGQEVKEESDSSSEQTKQEADTSPKQADQAPEPAPRLAPEPEPVSDPQPKAEPEPSTLFENVAFQRQRQVDDAPDEQHLEHQMTAGGELAYIYELMGNEIEAMLGLTSLSDVNKAQQHKVMIDVAFERLLGLAEVSDERTGFWMDYLDGRLIREALLPEDFFDTFIDMAINEQGKLTDQEFFGNQMAVDAIITSVADAGATLSDIAAAAADTRHNVEIQGVSTATWLSELFVN